MARTNRNTRNPTDRALSVEEICIALGEEQQKLKEAQRRVGELRGELDVRHAQALTPRLPTATPADDA